MNSIFSAFLSFLILPSNYTINHSQSVKTSFGGMHIENMTPNDDVFQIEIKTRIYFQDIGPVEYDYIFEEKSVFFTKSFVEHLWIKGSFQTPQWKAQFIDFISIDDNPDCASLRVESFETGVVAGLIVCFGDKLELKRITYHEKVGNESRSITFDQTGIFF